MPELRDIYRAAVEAGMKADPRGIGVVRGELVREKEKFEKLSDEEKKEFDSEKLINPYADTRVLHEPADAHEIKTALVGIDMETPEILLCEALKKNGRKIDAVIAHHPEGKAYARFYEVMKMQSDIFSAAGVPINIVEDLTAERMSEVARRVAPANHERAVDAARLLDVPFMCVHTPADNHVASHLSKLFAEKKPEFLDDVVKTLKDIPEYRAAIQAGSGPFVLVGDKSRRAGRVLVDMTGGTEGSKDIFNSLATSGVGTVVAMHLSEDHYKKAKENRVNVVVAGHISSDNLGLNLLFDALKIGGIALDIVPCSGFRRFSRVS